MPNKTEDCEHLTVLLNPYPSCLDCRKVLPVDYIVKTNRILYCACGSFISIDVQDMQKSETKKCLLCCLKDAIELMRTK